MMQPGSAGAASPRPTCAVRFWYWCRQRRQWARRCPRSIAISAHFINDVQTVVSREKVPFEFGVITVEERDW